MTRNLLLIAIVCGLARPALAQPRCVYTVGHSKHELSQFVRLLRQHHISVLADVRSMPGSRRAPQFNQQALQQELTRNAIRYCYLGDRLGGKPRDRSFYDDPARRKKVSLDRIEASAGFQQGLAELTALLNGQQVALMCAEENPGRCHRNRLIAPNLVDRGLQVQHIRGDGRLEAFSWSSLGQRTARRRAGRP